jgi:hypothetical protein
MKKMVSTRTHGVMDYLLGIILIASPWLFWFADNRSETILPVLLGFSIIIYSLFTDYELGVFKKISLPVHLRLDLISGILLAMSPWLFDFKYFVFMPHLVLGLIEVVTALSTPSHPSEFHLSHHRH